MSLPPATALKSNEFIGKLRTLGRHSPVDELTLNRIKREAKRLVRADPGGMHVVLGIIAGMEGSIEGVHQHYAIAMGDTVHRTTTVCNYAGSLVEAGDADRGFSVALEGHEAQRDDLRVLRVALQCAGHAGRFTESLTLHDRWNALCPEKPQNGEREARQIAEATANGAFAEEDLRRTLAIAHEERVARKILYEGITIYKAWREPDAFSIRIRVVASDEAVKSLDDQFLNRLMDDDELFQESVDHFTLIFQGRTANASDTERTA